MALSLGANNASSSFIGLSMNSEFLSTEFRKICHVFFVVRSVDRSNVCDAIAFLEEKREKSTFPHADSSSYRSLI